MVEDRLAGVPVEEIADAFHAGIAVGLAIPLFVEYAETGLVPRFPTAILAAATQIVALIFLICGIVLDSVCQLRRDAKRLTYLGISRAPR